MTQERINLPNALSLLRILLVAPFLLSVIYGHFAMALVLVMVAGGSDFLDGYLARHLGQKTILGSFLDPLGDRLLSTVAYVSLALQGVLPAWLAVIVVAKDIYVGIGAGFLYLTGRLPVAEASLWGKLTTVLQLVTICLALVATVYHTTTWLLDILFVVTALVTIGAGLHYIWLGLNIMQDGSPGSSGEQ